MLLQDAVKMETSKGPWTKRPQLKGEKGEDPKGEEEDDGKG
jgi:hypothetical protein